MSEASKELGSSRASSDREGPQPREQEVSAPLDTRANLKRVRDHIASLPPNEFDMGDWGNPSCGTPACIGGWAEHLVFGGSTYLHTTCEVGAAIGLSPAQCQDLFFMDNSELEYEQIDNQAAVKVLDHLLETGVVDWSVAGLTPRGAA